MMFGTRETFDYFECASCGCLQIRTIPEDLSPYYPPSYYSFAAPSRLRGFVKGAWLCDPFPIEAALQRVLALVPGTHLMPEWMGRAKLSRKASVLEVGSGGGMRLLAMQSAGFSDLTGADPFMEGDRELPGGIKILKQDITQLERRWDFVMLHHAYEHMPGPFETLQQLRQILSKDGTLLIRIPVASSLAWEKYGVNWMALDPPRHLFLHTVKSFTQVAEKAGLRIVDSFHDADPSQFWGSEQYLRDIPLRDPRSYFENRRTSIFTLSQLRHFRSETQRLNKEGLGIQRPSI